ncbi:hypothetical protein vseg_008128 [Gypsophila vaccaria]
MDNFGFWNVRGMNNSRKQNDINFFLHNKEIGLFGLIETKVKNNAMAPVQSKFKQWCVSTNNGYHKGGRIWIVWKPQVYRVQFLEYNAQYIHMKIESLMRRQSFYYTVIYAFNNAQDRLPLWHQLRRLAAMISGPWAIGGDFNCILYANEKVGGNLPLGVEQFRSCLTDCGMLDAPSVGAFYTWNNRQQATDRVFSKLDRLLVNKEWSDCFPSAFAHFLPEGISDHSPCLVQFSVQEHSKKSFKYYNMWGRADNFLSVVSRTWNCDIQGHPMFRIANKLKNLKKPLKELNRTTFSNIEVQATEMELKIQKLQEQLGQDPMNWHLREEESQARKEYIPIKQAKMSYLAQQAKQAWIKGGDVNSAYFHGVIRGRRTKNKVLMIEDEQGNIGDTPSAIQQTFLNYYVKLLGRNQKTTQVYQTIINCGKQCTPDMTNLLLEPITGQEVKDALFSIPDMKTPGPDGFTSKFFKDAWAVVGPEVIEAVRDFFTHKRLLKQINATSLVLIPKTHSPKNVQQFRPIACCNVIYKIIAKLLCTRLARVLPLLIDLNLGAFIHERSIQENILIFQELVRLYERPNSTAKCMFKIDMQKAYDTVEWDFLEQLLIHLRFPNDFIALIMECVSTASYSLVVNGDSFGFFKGKRGLRQGDPLSPLLFTICMEYLTRTLQYAAKKYEFKFHPMCKELKLINLMFADDVLMFCKGEAATMMTLLKAFTLFSKTSGLTVSKQKSAIFFDGVQEDLRQDILRVSGFAEGTLPFTYLGIPIQTTRIQKKDCASLIDKVCHRIHLMNPKHISYAGRLVMVKAVITTLHSYWASIFILPKGVLERIEATCRNFLWDSSADYKRVPLVAWNKLCKPKEEGGLGIKCLEISNQAMIGRLVHWIVEDRDSLWVKWIQSNFLKGRNWLNYQPPASASWIWKKICAVKEILTPSLTAGYWNNQTDKYTPAGAYNWLRTPSPTVSWHKFIWNKWSLPKHQFIGWLYAQEALQTNDKLRRCGLDIADDCFLCGQYAETADHIFFSCPYSSQVISWIRTMTSLPLPTQDILDWCLSRQGSTMQQSISNAISIGAIYYLWKQRNAGRLELKLSIPKTVAHSVLQDIRMVIRSKYLNTMTQSDKEWLKDKNLM